MFGIRKITAVLALLAALSVGAADVKLPIKMTDLAERFKHSCPGNVKISVQGDTLVISLAEADRKGGFEGAYALNLKKLAGKRMTVMIDVKISDVDHAGNVPSTVGRMFFGESVQNLTTRYTGWHTYTFKSVKIPGNGMLKMRVSLKNLSGEIQIRNPHVKVDIPKPPKKKKKKKN